MPTDYDIHVDGVHAGDLPMAVLRDLATLVVEGTTRAARLAAEGRSVSRGAAPAWLAQASEVRLTALKEGSLAIELQARPLAEMAPDVFAQQSLFGVLNGETTAVDLLMDALDDALHSRRDSERLDGGMLELLASTRGLFGRGATRLTIARHGKKPKELQFGAPAVSTFQTLAEATPAARVDRVVGVLDSLTLSTKTFVLKVDEKSTLRGLAGSVSLEVLKGLMGKRIVVEGTVAFRPSGLPQRVEADHAAVATTSDLVWERQLRADVGPAALISGAANDLKSLFGEWPGDEDDDVLFAALDELS